jgi:hypothetical protein
MSRRARKHMVALRWESKVAAREEALIKIRQWWYMKTILLFIKEPLYGAGNHHTTDAVTQSKRDQKMVFGHSFKMT